jgi:hypothetical protein|nr:MAG TPA: transcriptional repressor [Caudoviricetes sp.]
MNAFKRKEVKKMLKKKGIVQKTFRLDYDLNEDFETLCEILERTQNDLANVAIQNLLEDNKDWLAKNILVDYAVDFFWNASDSQFEVDNVNVQIKYNEDESVHLKIIHKDTDGSIIQTVDKTYKNDTEAEKKIKYYLRYFGQVIDRNCMQMQEYLKDKLNYK